jgi:2-succinyl-6-hydroxy-2,4-cyclohexadiene-1-carboxylate synthase
VPGGDAPPGEAPAPGFRPCTLQHPVVGGRLTAWVGEGGAPPGSTPLVLLHGFTGSAHAWGSTLLTSLAHSRPVIAVDLPGHGASDWPLDDEGMSVASVGDLLAEALPEWVGAAPGKPVQADWLGYSMGARIALTVATSRPGVVSRLILESGTPGLATEGERRARREADEGLARSLEQGGVAPFVERWLALPLFAGIRALPPDEFQEEERRRLANPPHPLAGVLRRLGTGTQPDLRGALSAMDIPTLLLAGGNDTKFALLAREMETLIPGARRVEWPGVGHVPHRELSSELWLGVVEEFLSRPGAPQSPPISSRKASP